MYSVTNFIDHDITEIAVEGSLSEDHSYTSTIVFPSCCLALLFWGHSH